MRRAGWLLFCVLLGTIGGARTVVGYSLLGSSWPTGGTVNVQLRLGPAPYPLRDGSASFDASALQAMNTWNAQTVKVQMASEPPAGAAPADGDRINSVFFSDTIYGDSFGTRTLAVTIRHSDGPVTVEADVIFNQARSWDSYHGSVPTNDSDAMDLRRVALHEFGHVLGLGHPDRGGEFVDAIMYSIVNNLSQLRPDDIAGVDALYGARFTIPPSVTAVVGEPFSMQMTVDSPTTGMSVYPEPTGLRFNPQTGVLSGTPVEERTFETKVTAYVKNWARQISQPLTVTVLPRQRDFPTFLDFTQAVRHYNTTRHYYFTPDSQLKVTRNHFNEVMVTAGSFGPRIVFRAAANANLEPGVYEGAVRGYVPEPQYNVLDVSGTSQCDDGIGRFEVKQITYGAKNTILSFWAVFEQDCRSGLRVTNRGEIRFHVDADDPLPVPSVSAPAGITGTQGQPVSFRVSSGTAGAAFDAIGLPRGMYINSITGEVNGQPTLGGTFHVRILATDQNDLTGETPLTMTIAGTPPPARSLLNISTRARNGSGDDSTIAGFIIKGNQTKGVLMRVLGPSLVAAGVPADQALSDPRLIFYKGSSEAAVEDWMPRTNMYQTSTWDWKMVPAVGLTPPHWSEPAIYQDLGPGGYTVVVGGKNDGNGIALAEVYDIDPRQSSLANISTRARVGSGDDVLIGGFIIGGTEPTKIIVRAIGPSLSARGVRDPLADPTLTLYNGDGVAIATNDDWRSEQPQQIIDTTIPPSDEREAAIVRTLQPGSYTAIVEGKGGASGVGLVEVYNLD